MIADIRDLMNDIPRATGNTGAKVGKCSKNMRRDMWTSLVMVGENIWRRKKGTRKGKRRKEANIIRCGYLFRKSQ